MNATAEPQGPAKRVGRWIAASIGTIVIAIVTAWTLHWIGPAPNDTAQTPLIKAEELVGKWIYPDGLHYWVIRPSADKYSIEYYAPGDDLVGEGEGHTVGRDFQFTLNAKNHFVNGTLILEAQPYHGRLMLRDGKLTGPTDELGLEMLEGNASHIATLTLKRE